MQELFIQHPHNYKEIPSCNHKKAEESGIPCFVICLTMDEVVWPKKGPNVASSYTVHCPRLQVNKQGPGDIFTTCKQNRNVYLYRQPELKCALTMCQSLSTVIFKKEQFG